MHLKQCVLTGNPCALLPNYRKRVAFGLPQLARLDDAEVAPVDAADGDDASITIHVALRALLGLSGAPPTAADEASPEEEGVFVELLVVGAPPATARRTRRLPWRAAPVAPPAPDAEGSIPVEVALEVPAVAAVRDGLEIVGPARVRAQGHARGRAGGAPSASAPRSSPRRRCPSRRCWAVLRRGLGARRDGRAGLRGW